MTAEKPKKAKPVPATPTRCQSCGSTERTGYHRTIEESHPGTDPNGLPCTHIVRRWTACAACGQQRVDRSYENRLPRTSQN